MWTFGMSLVFLLWVVRFFGFSFINLTPLIRFALLLRMDILYMRIVFMSIKKIDGYTFYINNLFN